MQKKEKNHTNENASNNFFLQWTEVSDNILELHNHINIFSQNSCAIKNLIKKSQFSNTNPNVSRHF